MRTLAAILTILVLTGSPAFAVTHKATGFGVEPPFPFTAEPLNYPGAAAAFGIVGFGKPTPPGDDRYLCLIGYTPSPPSGPIDQAHINSTYETEEYRAALLASSAAHFEIASSAMFDEDGITGIEMIGTPKGREGSDAVRLFVSMFETPIGRVSMSCATTADQIDAATETFRTLRHTIIVPTGTE